MTGDAVLTQAKILFCCVGSFRGQGAIPCNKHTKSRHFLQRFLSVAGVFVLIFSLMAFSVSAADANGNDWLDLDDYAEYSFSDDKTIVNIDCVFPTSWIETYLYDGSFSGSSLIESYKGSPVIVDELVDDMHLFIRPNAGDVTTGPDIGTQLKNAHIIDLTVLPTKTSFVTSFYITVDVDVARADNFEGYQRLFFVDGEGKIVKKYNLFYYPKEIGYSDGKYVFAYEITTDLSNISLPESVVGFIPCYQLWETYDNNLSYQIDSITYEPFSFFYSLSDLEYEVQQNNALKSTLEDVQSALADQDKKLDELPGQIGDQMQNVMDTEKEQANEEGNKFVDQILDKLPDPSQGILDALGDLTAAINYTGTDATLAIPAIVLPGIDGLFPETEIWGGADFSFSDYVEMMPSGLLTLVKSLFTIAIVLFCVYELKGIISYCLTLREKDGG